MAQLGKGKLNYRCPSCFMRDLDIDMFTIKIQASTAVSAASTEEQKQMFLRKTRWCVSATSTERSGLRSLILTKK